MTHHDHGEHHETGVVLLGPGDWTTALLLLGAVATYTYAVFRLHRRDVGWPKLRMTAWTLGCLSVGLALVGPLAIRAHDDFVAHMAGHVLLGMLGPLLLVLAAPGRLALRVLPVAAARHVARVLASAPVAVLTNPFVAGVLNIGSLWILYRSGLYAAMHTEPLLHALVHVHVVAAGYLFTFAVLGGPDPAPHRPSPPWRVTALVLAIAAHNVLAKTIYADPPEGVPVEQAQAGAQFMYYVGAPIEIALLVLVCRPWLLPRNRPPRLMRRCRTLHQQSGSRYRAVRALEP
ncbi:cytochrome c oxidase assembly protein [Mycobacterium sp. smrl_JER01]|uniref:cytochrome c oxidase assembly protein n=1 Tax=Mycobacterium sp. smrl_JER01 TaxID=3402633 RepID=UPI003AC2DE43